MVSPVRKLGLEVPSCTTITTESEFGVGSKFIRLESLQNEIAPKRLSFQNEKRNEKRNRKFEKRPETSPKNIKPCSPKSFHRPLFTVLHPHFQTQFQTFFHNENLQGCKIRYSGVKTPWRAFRDICFPKLWDPKEKGRKKRSEVLRQQNAADSSAV